MPEVRAIPCPVLQCQGGRGAGCRCWIGALRLLGGLLGKAWSGIVSRVPCSWRQAPPVQSGNTCSDRNPPAGTWKPDEGTSDTTSGLTLQDHAIRPCDVMQEPPRKLSLLMLFGSDAVRCTLLSYCICSTSTALHAVNRELARGLCDGGGRLLTASAVLPPASMAHRLKRLSPQLLSCLSLPSITGEASLTDLVAVAPDLQALRDVSIHLAAPRLPRVTGESREDRARSAASLARALRVALPPWLKALDADLRGGCLLAGDNALAELVSTIPQSLESLRLDLNHYSARDARAVAAMIPSGLRELQVRFHGRSFLWLGGAGAEDVGLQALSCAMPRHLRKLQLMLECSDDGAAVLCNSLPKGLVELDLDLHLMGRPRPAPERLPEALAAALSSQMVALRLRLAECAVNVRGLKLLADAIPQGLVDLRLDLCGRDVGNEGAEVLASALPKGLARLSLCLRTWRFTELGARALAHAMPRHVRRLKVVLSASPIGIAGVKALIGRLPVRLERLNLSLRLCGVGADGERVLRPLARRWNPRPRSWVRVHEKSSPICQGLEDSREWDLWDD
mmetsp:Transcript_79247/g.232737  ORF Transcript_79247/g.232737 Transcript_79247/m.232737 type:complete len:565 (+) Transcript_79247:55-1749(+)